MCSMGYLIVTFVVHITLTLSIYKAEEIKLHRHNKSITEYPKLEQNTIPFDERIYVHIHYLI